MVSTTSGNQVEGPSGRHDFSAQESFFYDLHGRTRLTRVRSDAFRSGTEYDLVHTFDNLDNTLTTTTPTFEGSPGDCIEHSYDLLGRMVTASVNGSQLARFEYNLLGSVGHETLTDGETSIGERTLCYNSPGWLTYVNGPHFKETIEYTEGGVGDRGYFNGSPARITLAARGPNPQIESRFEYDLLGRLSNAITSSDNLLYSYDSNGNLTQLGEASLNYHDNDQVRSREQDAHSSEYQYDADGNLVKRSAAVPLPPLTLGFDWFRGMPLSVVVNDNPSTTVDLRYGYENRRLLRTVSSSNLTTKLLYLRGAGDAPFIELSSDGGSTLHVLGPRGLTALRVNETNYQVATDVLGSVRAVFDASGTVLGGYDYRPYGMPLGIPFGAQPSIIDYRFTNRQLDPSGLYDFRARFYDPTLGRFVSLDPKEQLLSPYVYAAGNPLLLVDPSGEFIFSAIFTALAATISAIATAALIGLSVGAVVGGVQAIATITENNLSGAEAAGVFFGFLGLGAAAGAIGGATVGAVSALTVTTATSVIGGALAGAAVGAGTGAAKGAGQAALLGRDPNKGAAFGAIGGAVGGAVGGGFGGLGAAALRVAAAAPPAAQSSQSIGNIIKIVGNTVGDATTGLLTTGLQGKNTPKDTRNALIATLQGVAYGVGSRSPART